MATRREARERALGSATSSRPAASSADDAARRPRRARPIRTPSGSCAASTRTATRSTRCSRKLSEHWALERMPAVDRALLRIGGYELGWEPELPTAVVIDEAVELAGRVLDEGLRPVRERAAVARSAEELRA